MLCCSADPTEIIPKLFVGSISAVAPQRLEQHGIKRVLDVSALQYQLPENTVRQTHFIDDSPAADISQHFVRTNEFIAEGLRQGVPSSSHCVNAASTALHACNRPDVHGLCQPATVHNHSMNELA